MSKLTMYILNSVLGSRFSVLAKTRSIFTAQNPEPRTQRVALEDRVYCAIKSGMLIIDINNDK